MNYYTLEGVKVRKKKDFYHYYYRMRFAVRHNNEEISSLVDIPIIGSHLNKIHTKLKELAQEALETSRVQMSTADIIGLEDMKLKRNTAGTFVMVKYKVAVQSDLLFNQQVKIELPALGLSEQEHYYFQEMEVDAVEYVESQTSKPTNQLTIV